MNSWIRCWVDLYVIFSDVLTYCVMLQAFICYCSYVSCYDTCMCVCVCTCVRVCVCVLLLLLFIGIVQRNWACLTWKSAIEIKSLLFYHYKPINRTFPLGEFCTFARYASINQPTNQLQAHKKSLHKSCTHTEGFWPEWYISTMIYSRVIQFWSEILDMKEWYILCYMHTYIQPNHSVNPTHLHDKVVRQHQSMNQACKQNIVESLKNTINLHHTKVVAEHELINQWHSNRL